MGIIFRPPLPFLDALSLPHLRQVVHPRTDPLLDTDRSHLPATLPRESTFRKFASHAALDSNQRNERTERRVFLGDTDWTESSVDIWGRLEWRRSISDSVQQRFFLSPRRQHRESTASSSLDASPRWQSTLSPSIVFLRFCNRRYKHEDLAVRRLSS